LENPSVCILVSLLLAGCSATPAPTAGREEKGAAEAGFEVGYDDASHFNRDYKRQFGEPPLRDIQRLKESAGSALQAG